LSKDTGFNTLLPDYISLNKKAIIMSAASSHLVQLH